MDMDVGVYEGYGHHSRSMHFIHAPLDVFLHLVSWHLRVDEDFLRGFALPRDELEAVHWPGCAERDGEPLPPPLRLSESSRGYSVLVRKSIGETI